MTYPKPKPKSRLILILLVLLLVVGGAFFIYKSKSRSTTNNPTTTQDNKDSKSLNQETIEGNGFSYAKPEGWAKLSSELLKAQQADSGIGHTNPGGSVVTFVVKVLSSTPANDTELKNAVLAAPKYLPGFELITSESIKVNDKSGQRFSYRFGEGIKTKQELNAVVFNKKTYVLLFSSVEIDFDERKPDMAKILNSFNFK